MGEYRINLKRTNAVEQHSLASQQHHQSPTGGIPNKEQSQMAAHGQRHHSDNRITSGLEEHFNQSYLDANEDAGDCDATITFFSLQQKNNTKLDERVAAALSAMPAKKSRSFDFKEDPRQVRRVLGNMTPPQDDRTNDPFLLNNPNDTERNKHLSGKLSSMPTRKSRSFHFEERPGHVGQRFSDTMAPPQDDRTNDPFIDFSNDTDRLDHVLGKLARAGITEDEITVRSFRSQSSGNVKPPSYSTARIKPAGASTWSGGKHKIVKVDELASRLIDFKKAAKISAGTTRTANFSAGTSKTKGLSKRHSFIESHPPVPSQRNNSSSHVDVTSSRVVPNLPQNRAGTAGEGTSMSNSDLTSRFHGHVHVGPAPASQVPVPAPPLSENHNIKSGNSMTVPPPPPPPPRPSISLSGRQRDGNPPSAVDSKPLSFASSAAATSVNNTVNIGEQRKPPAPPFSSQVSKDSGAIKHRDNRIGNSEQRINGSISQRRQSEGGRNEMAKLSSSFNSGDTSKGNKASFHKNSTKNGGKNKSSSQVLDGLSENLLASHTEAEAADFKKFCHLSLPQLELLESLPQLESSSSHSINNGHNDSKKSIINSNNKNNSSLVGHEFSNSSINFTPRPVRVTQFEDTDDESDSPTTPKKVTTTTTVTFLNSIRQMPPDNGANPTNTPVGETPSISSVSHYKSPNSAKTQLSSTSNNYKAPSSSSSSTRTPSSAKITVDSLPDNIDKKGRCLRHPKVKLYKKKILGGYEMIRETCPNCEEEAPYESLWRGQARAKKGSSHPQREHSNERGVSSREPNGPKERKRSRSIERKSRSNEKVGDSRLEDISLTFPCISSLLRGEHQDDDVPSRGFSAPALQGIPPPPLHKGNRPSPPPRSRAKSFERRPSLDRVRSNSVRRRGRAPPSISSAISSENSPPIVDKSSLSESKSLFDKGIGKLSSFQNRARSSSRKRAPAHEESLSLSHSDVAKKVLSQKNKFDKKTGRCKNHPSVLLARKSKFSKGWDIIREECPLCNESNKDGLGGDEEFCEISRKKMNAMLRGNPSLPFDAMGSPSDTINPSMMGGGGGGSSSTRMSQRKIVNETTNKPHENTKAHHTNNKPHENTKARHRHSTPDTLGVMDDLHSHERVSRMPYTTPWGESGWYTGEVNHSGKPHGQGRMRSKTGNHIDTEWTNGYSAEFLEKQGRMKSGFGTNIAKWKGKDVVEGGRRSSSERQRSSSSGAAQMSSKSSHSMAQYQNHQGQYQGAPSQNAAYHSSPYGMAPYTQDYQAGAAAAAGMMPNAGMWNNQSPGYQCYPTQSPGGQHMPPPPPYRPGYHQ